MNLDRDKEIRSVFARSWKDLRPILSSHRLTVLETVFFKRVLSLWFRRFADRFGNENLPVNLLAGTLTEAARQWIGKYHHENPGISVADSGEGH